MCVLAVETAHRTTSAMLLCYGELGSLLEACRLRLTYFECSLTRLLSLSRCCLGHRALTTEELQRAMLGMTWRMSIAIQRHCSTMP